MPDLIPIEETASWPPTPTNPMACLRLAILSVAIVVMIYPNTPVEFDMYYWDSVAEWKLRELAGFVGMGGVMGEERAGEYVRAHHKPYVSIIMAGRVDTLRGADFVQRAGRALEVWQSLGTRHNLMAELVVVEWNRLPGAKSLADALRPHVLRHSNIPVRIISVPPSVHDTRKGGTNATFYEFMAKNVGARRARGEFVLLTNPDNMPSEALVQFLAKRKLDHDAFFRALRVQVDGASLGWETRPPDEVLQSIQKGVLRGNNPNPEGQPPDMCGSDGSREWNKGVCERGFLGRERRDEHKGLSDTLLFSASGDFFLTKYSNLDAMAGHFENPATLHMDSLLLCKASGIGLRQVIVDGPCVTYHQRHEAFDADGVPVSYDCGKEQEHAGTCRNRGHGNEHFEPTEARCGDVGLSLQHELADAGWSRAQAGAWECRTERCRKVPADSRGWGHGDAKYRDVFLSWGGGRDLHHTMWPPCSLGKEPCRGSLADALAVERGAG